MARHAEAIVTLEATVRQSADVTILDLEGRATIGPGNDLLASELGRLVQGGARKLLVNLRDVKQVDSSSISTLVRTFVSLQNTGGSLKLLSPQGRVRAVLSLTRLLKAIPSFDDEAAALASFQ